MSESAYHKLGFLSMARKFAPMLGGKLMSKTLGGNVATKGMGTLVKQYAGGGAAAGGLIGGGFGALGAEDGQRLQGFASGAAQGAAHGAVGGALSGAINAPLRNLRTIGMAKATNKGVADKTLSDGVWDNLKTSVGRGADKSKDAIRAARIESLAAPATATVDMAASGAIMDAGMKLIEPPPPPPPPGMPPGPPPVPRVNRSGGELTTRTASAVEAPGSAPNPLDEQTPHIIEPFLVTPITGVTGKILSDKGVSRFMPKLPEGVPEGPLRRHILPAAAAMALTVPAIKAIRAYNERQAPDPLEQLDMDALKTYFGKQPEHADRNH